MIDIDNITITILCSVTSAFVRWYGALNTVKKNTADDTSKLTTLNVSIEFIKDSLEEIKSDLKESRNDRKNITTDMGILESRVKSLEKRVEKLENKCKQFGGDI